MTTALIGWSGFVGGSLDRQSQFDERFRASDIEAMRGRSFELVACAAAPGLKWRANQEPGADRAAIARLVDVLADVEAERFVLMSTVDVYPSPIGVTEADEPEPHPQAYGRHRRELELFVAGRYAEHLIVRLPGLYGDGLRKNAIHDLLQGRNLEQLRPDAVFQFLDIDSTWARIAVALDRGLRLVHMPTEPVALGDVARHAFGVELAPSASTGDAPRYDLRTMHAEIWGRTGPYLLSRAEVMDDLAQFVQRQRSKMSR